MMRAMLYEAAHIMLVRVAKWSSLKAWTMELARHRGIKKRTSASRGRTLNCRTVGFQCSLAIYWTFRRNDQVAAARVTTAIATIGQIRSATSEIGMSRRKTPRSMTTK